MTEPSSEFRAAFDAGVAWANATTSRPDHDTAVQLAHDTAAREVSLRLARIQNALIGELGHAATASTRAALERVLDVLDEEARRPLVSSNERQVA